MHHTSTMIVKNTMKSKILILLLLLACAHARLIHPPPPHQQVPRAGGVAAAVASNLIQKSVDDATKSLLETWNWKDIAVAVFSAVASLSSGSAMIIEDSLLVTIVGWLCITLGASAVVLQKKLSDLETMRQLNNEMIVQVNSLSQANGMLKKQNTRLGAATKELKKAEGKLEEISKSQGVSVDTLVKQVQQYRQIQEKVKEDLKAKIKQTLLSVVMRSDLDQDYLLDENEVGVVVLRLNALPNVEFNENAFRKAIKKDKGSLVTFMNEHLHSDERIAKDKIFVF